MNNLIDRIKANGFPVDSFVQAHRILCEKELSDYQYGQLVFDLVGAQAEPTNPKPFCGYLIQEAIRQHMAGEEVITTVIIQMAQDKAAAYVVRSTPTSQPLTQEVVTDGVVVGYTTTVPKKKGGASKKELCLALFANHKELNRKDMVALFVKELGLTPAGASTYVHNCKHGIWQ